MKPTYWILLGVNILALIMIGVTFERAYLQGHEAATRYGFVLQGSRSLEIAKALHEKNIDKALDLTNVDIADDLDFLVRRNIELRGDEIIVYDNMRTYLLTETKKFENSGVNVHKNISTEKFLLSVRKKIIESERSASRTH